MGSDGLVSFTQWKDYKEIIANYFLQFPKIKDYMNYNINFAREHGYRTEFVDRRR